MSAKFVNVFADENPELQKQIGCMSGIFQMFDRQHILSGRRLSTQKRLPSVGDALPNSSSIGGERNVCPPKIVLEKNLSKISMESSRTSFPSSTCSSFSSLECNRSIQQELPTFDRTILSEAPLKTSPKVKPSDNGTGPIIVEPCSERPHGQASQHSLDFREVVKDSIYRDARALSIKTSTKDEVKPHFLKHRDSPRPVQLPKSVDGSYGMGLSGNSRMPMDLHESIRVLVKLKEAPWNFSEAVDPPRTSYESKDAPYNPVSREARRFSYDGRESSCAYPDYREQDKHISKLRELPRLSLDSREGSMRHSNFDSVPNPTFNDLDRSISHASSATNYQNELGTHKRSPSVVGKLMGLEAMPNSTLAAQEPVISTKSKAHSDYYDAKDISNFISKSSSTTQVSKHELLSRSPRNSIKNPTMPQLNKPNAVMKSISNSSVPIEPAPWRQLDGVRAPRKAKFGHHESHLKPQPETVYSEIEKKLKELEFRQCNKDLRALKQILDAMQAKGLLENKKSEEQHSELPAGRTNSSRQSQVAGGHNLNSANGRNQQNTYSLPTLTKGSNMPRAFESPIVIMKPAKSVGGSGISASSAIPLESFSGLRKLHTSDPMVKRKGSINNKFAKDRTPRYSSKDITDQPVVSSSKNVISRSEENSSRKTQSLVVQTSSRPPQSPREKNGSSLKSPNSLSPRLQQIKLETERKLCPPLPSAESNKPQRPSSNKQPSESVSPRYRLRRKPTRVQENDDQLSETSDTRNLSQQGDELSQRSDSNISVASLLDGEVMSADRSANTSLSFIQQGASSPSGKAANRASSVFRQKKASLNLSEHVSTKELTVIAPEQPSPISVLDSSFYQDMSPPPVKKSSNALKDKEARASNHIWNLLPSPDPSSPKLSSSINHKKLENIQHLVQKLSELSSNDDGARTTDHIALLCETENPDHRYVSEILLASGLLLKDLTNGPMGSMPIQLHPSGHPINPDLFLVLEQTKTTWLTKPEAIQEKALRMKPRTEKLHRKLIFDVVNEILVQKLELTRQGAPANLLLRARKLIGPFPSGQRLLRELCSEIEQLQADNSRGNIEDDDVSVAGADVLHRSVGWNDFSKEMPGIVLEIERAIFKDLIDEVVSGETASVMQPKSSRRRRQLFAK